MNNDQLDEPSISPYKVRSYVKALQALGIDTNLATTAGNSGTIATRLNEIKTQNTQIISLLQQLVDK